MHADNVAAVHVVPEIAIDLLLKICSRAQIRSNDLRDGSPYCVVGFLYIRNDHRFPAELLMVPGIVRDEMALVYEVAAMTVGGKIPRYLSPDMRRNRASRIRCHDGLEVVFPDGVAALVSSRSPITCPVLEVRDWDAAFLKCAWYLREGRLNQTEETGIPLANDMKASGSRSMHRTGNQLLALVMIANWAIGVNEDEPNEDEPKAARPAPLAARTPPMAPNRGAHSPAHGILKYR
jgi:hypothetical protein